MTMAATRVCDDCGERNPAGTQFCHLCGHYLGWTDEEEATSDRPEPAGPQAAPSSQPADDEPPVGLDEEAPSAVSQPRVVEQAMAARADTPVPSHASTAAAEPPTSVSIACPACGQRNDLGRTLCSRCGHVLRPRDDQADSKVTSPKRGWWARLWDTDARAARRAYRRSLPSRYRWFRAAMAALAVGGAAALALALTRDPIGWVRETWFDVRDETVAVTGVSATTSPEPAVVEGFEGANAVDGDITSAWGIAWPADTLGAQSCGEARGLGSLVLALDEPARVRQILLLAGLDENDADRDRQFRPKEIDVAWTDGGCVRLQLDDTGDAQTRDLDTGAAVQELTLTIASAHPPDSDSQLIERVSITELRLLRQPT